MARLHFLFHTAMAMAMALPGAAAFMGCDREVIELLEADEGAESGGAGGDSGAPGPSPTALPVDASSKPSPPAGCTSNAECGPELPACDSARGVCVRCMSSLDCERSWERCDPSTHQCVDCLVHEDCPPDMFCSAGRCVMCEDDSDCPFPQFPYCDGRLRYCVQCMDDRDCQFDAHCQFGGVCR